LQKQTLLKTGIKPNKQYVKKNDEYKESKSGLKIAFDRLFGKEE